MTVHRLSLGDDDIRSPTHPVLQPRLLAPRRAIYACRSRRSTGCLPCFCAGVLRLASNQAFGGRIEYSGRSETARATPMSSGRFLLS